MDFTLKTYRLLLRAFTGQGYQFISFEHYIARKNNIPPDTRMVILRHDIDKLPENALKTAHIEQKLGIEGSYYFRTVPQSFNPNIIRQIAGLGHEIGYHYETMDSAHQKLKKQKDRKKPYSYTEVLENAYIEFTQNLETLRSLYPITTICMHGSPKSAFDNRDIWKKYSYRKLGIIGEPYFDINFDEIFYLTDTGRRWDGYRFSVRDKVPQQQHWIAKGLSYRTTRQLIGAIRSGSFPNRVMITVHPQRWTNRLVPWIKELILQSVKNIVKALLIRYGK